jgi:putative endonuclease
MTNDNNSVIYKGVTSDLRERIVRHRSKKYPGSFTARYNISKLVYYEQLETIVEAIKREKQIKAGPRKRKIDLINSMSPEWEDLSLVHNGS